MPRPKLTRNNAQDIASPGKVRVTNLHSACRCGCQGTDPWHRREYDRVVRNVTIHPVPIVLSEGSAEWGIPAKHEIARGVARFPFGTAPVRAVVLVHNGAPSRFVDWERVA